MTIKKYIDKTDSEKIADDVEWLTMWCESHDVASTIDLVAKRFAFINTRAVIYRKKLTELGVDINDLLTESGAQ